MSTVVASVEKPALASRAPGRAGELAGRPRPGLAALLTTLALFLWLVVLPLQFVAYFT